jgi:hypothetical protein
MKHLQSLLLVLAGEGLALATPLSWSQCPAIGSNPPIDTTSTPSQSQQVFAHGVDSPYDIKVHNGRVFAATADGVMRFDPANPSAAPVAITSDEQSWGEVFQTHPSGDTLLIEAAKRVPAGGGSAVHGIHVKDIDGAAVQNTFLPATGPVLSAVDGPIYACRNASTHLDVPSWDPGTIAVDANVGSLAFAVNECEDHGSSVDHRGTIDVIDTSGSVPHIVQRVRVDKNPSSVAVSSDNNYLFVTTEYAGPVAAGMASYTGAIGSQTGALLVFQILPLGPFHLVPVTAVPTGCIGNRLEVDGGHDWVYVGARMSNEIDVYSQSGLELAHSGTLVARIATGPEPGPIKVIDGGRGLAVANTFRTNDLNNHPGYPRPSVMVFKLASVLQDGGNTRHTMNMCRHYETPSDGSTFTIFPPSYQVGYVPQLDGDFPRNFAIDGTNLYTAMWGSGWVTWSNIPTEIHNAISACS